MVTGATVPMGGGAKWKLAGDLLLLDLSGPLRVVWCYTELPHSVVASLQYNVLHRTGTSV
jgi:hypothetical protein